MEHYKRLQAKSARKSPIRLQQYTRTRHTRQRPASASRSKAKHEKSIVSSVRMEQFSVTFGLLTPPPPQRTQRLSHSLNSLFLDEHQRPKSAVPVRATAVSPLKRDLLRVREVRRQKLIQMVGTCEISESEREFQNKAAQLERQYEQKRRTEVEKRERLEEALSTARSELESARSNSAALETNLNLIRQRLQLLMAREMQNQKRLHVFRSLEPILEKVRRMMDFSDAREVVERFSVLEQKVSEHFESRQHYEGRCKELERANAVLRQKLNDTTQNLQAEVEDEISKRERAEMKARNLVDREARVRATEHEYRDKYMALTRAVWEAWEEAKSIGLPAASASVSRSRCCVLLLA